MRQRQILFELEKAGLDLEEAHVALDKRGMFKAKEPDISGSEIDEILEKIEAIIVETTVIETCVSSTEEKIILEELATDTKLETIGSFDTETSVTVPIKAQITVETAKKQIKKNKK